MTGAFWRGGISRHQEYLGKPVESLEEARNLMRGKHGTDKSKGSFFWAGVNLRLIIII